MKTIEDAVRKSGGVWPKRLLSKGSIGVMIWLDSDGGITVCTRTEFEQCARRLRNEPSWADAPDWAVAIAQDSDGEWYWHAAVPRHTAIIFKARPHRTEFAGKGEVIGDWKDTLWLRPEEKKMEDKNDWHKRGEFPPVGTVCEMLPWWHVCESIAPHRDGMVMYNHSEDAYFLATKNTRFRPPKTERDRWIEMAANIDIASPPHPETWPDILARIYDAGLAKMPEDK